MQEFDKIDLKKKEISMWKQKRKWNGSSCSFDKRERRGGRTEQKNVLYEENMARGNKKGRTNNANINDVILPDCKKMNIYTERLLHDGTYEWVHTH